MPHGSMGWSFRDLTTEDGAPLVSNFIDGYSVEGTSNECLVYASNTSIHELARDGGAWRHTNVSQAAGLGAEAIAGPVVGYAFRAQGTRHVIYVGAQLPRGGRQIFELWHDASGWHQKSLTAEADAPTPFSRPSAYVCEFDSTQHVVYVGEDHHVHELWWDADGWHWNDLTTASASPLAQAAMVWPVGCSSSALRSQFVSFVGDDLELHVMRWADGVWSRLDPVVDGRLIRPSSVMPVAYCASNGALHLTFAGEDGHVYELSFDGRSWSLEQASAGVGPIFGDLISLAAYQDDAQGTRHIVTFSFSRIHGFWREASAWHHVDVSAASGCPQPSSRHCAGYALRTQRRQHVAYHSLLFGHVIVLEWHPGPDLQPPAPPLPPGPVHPR